jgi:tetratricopeptide (TPR) repeat protein
MSLKFQRVTLLNAQLQYEEALNVVNQIIDTLVLKSDEPLGNLIPVNNNTVNAYTWRTKIALNLKDYDLALKDAERVVRMQPDKASSYILRGSVYTLRDRFEQAQTDFNHAISLHPDLNEELDLLEQRSRLASQRDKGKGSQSLSQ